MANVPRFAWPEPSCYLDGSVLHVSQARWKQETTFLPLVEPAKWMVAVFVGGTLRHGQQVGSPPGTPTTAATVYTGEMPLSQKTFSIDLAAYGVHDSHPLSPVVRVEQYAGSKFGATQWTWCGFDWEQRNIQLLTYIDSNAGVPKALTHQYEEPVDTWMPLSMGFYDEGVEPWHSETPTSPSAGVWQTLLNGAPFGAPNGSAGMQFSTWRPHQIIMGVQVWIPPYELSETSRPGTPYVRHGPGEPFIVRIWEGSYATAEDNVVAEIEVENPQPGWNNIWFDPGDRVQAKTYLIPGTPTPGNPYPYVTNPDHDGNYVVGFQTILGAYFEGPTETAGYQSLYPEHVKVPFTDHGSSITQLINRLPPAGYGIGPEWAPQFPLTHYIFCGPIILYDPIYPVPANFIPQIYRRVVTEVN